MKISPSQARKLAKQIQDRFGTRIHEATWGTIVPADFLAGLISVEAGKDRNGQIKEEATRFEPHVFAKLKQVRDGKLLQYNKIRQAQIKNASDETLRALATSCGLTQIMQWWTIHLGVFVAELRGPNHLKHAVRLLEMTAGSQLRATNYEGVLRIWNTGRATGKTHDPDYVFNASAVMDAYAELEPVIDLAVEPEGPEPTEPSVTTVPGKPPVIEVQPRSTSILTKIGTAVAGLGPIATATGLKIGNVEFNTVGIVAISAVIIVGMLTAAYLWNRSQERRSAELRASMSNLASPEKLNVVAGSGQP